jgi:hypothetical protein
MPGASPYTMAATVATPLERHLGIIADVAEMTSESTVGITRITLEFSLNSEVPDSFFLAIDDYVGTHIGEDLGWVDGCGFGTVSLVFDGFRGWRPDMKFTDRSDAGRRLSGKAISLDPTARAKAPARTCRAISPRPVWYIQSSRMWTAIPSGFASFSAVARRASGRHARGNLRSIGGRLKKDFPKRL